MKTEAQERDIVEMLGGDHTVSLRQVLHHAVVRLAEFGVGYFTYGRVGRQIVDRGASRIDVHRRDRDREHAVFEVVAVAIGLLVGVAHYWLSG